ncbi:hypothetical protein NR402_14785 [Acidithiobacillus ferrooxidans]|uniref:hypothetical protein n=1 Tax=Acidithiobacillus ferrooxidans TaxID=920 RepID=UPI00214CB973|nr:hypothetical protein [Acidithiobacillus ferrooxidans]MCR2831539.1 hypothetical protein [Acidithiobacillus ferrooxidans]
MSKLLRKDYRRCFIAAPFGLDLGVIPELLSRRGISWEWGKAEESERLDSKKIIEVVDFVIVVLNGTKSDYRCVLEAGVAVGLSKPIFLIQTKTRTLPLELGGASYVKSSLLNRDALSFHLDLFLSTPDSLPSKSDLGLINVKKQPRTENVLRKESHSLESQLEQRVYEAVLSAGGYAISQPKSEIAEKYRPDLLAWLGNLDSELLDPVVIEVKGQVDTKRAFMVDEQLLKFMQLAHLKMALVLTESPPPKREQQLSPNVLWFTISEFEKLVASGKFGEYVRATRNRIAHGVR